MRSKFVHNICFIKDEFYHNKMDKSPYIFVRSIEREETSRDNNYLSIYYIDIHGRKDKINQHKSWLYKNLDILELRSYLTQDFIKGVFV